MHSELIASPATETAPTSDPESLIQAVTLRTPLEDRDAIARRLRASLPRLLDRLKKLYGDSAGFSAWTQSLLATLSDIHARRSPELRALDRARQADPDWFLGQHMLAYSAYVDRFGGTLKGIEARLPHLKALGVTYLHLLPFLRARQPLNDGGFAVASYEEVEPALGTMEDLEALTALLRHAGISLCSDLVLNHVADTHPWALAAKAGSAKHRAYFHCLDRAQADAFEATLGQVFPETAPGNFTHVPEVDAHVWTTFYPYQWDLNYANPEVFAEMAATLLRLANRGIEVFRLDSAAFLWKRLGTDSMNQPEAHWILQAFRAIVDVFAPGVLMKAEAIVPTRELPPYLGEGEARGRECHVAYQSSLMAAAWLALATEDANVARRIVADIPPLPPHTSWLTYVRCHDDIGWNVLKPEFADGDIAPLRAASLFFSGAGASYADGASFQAVSPDAVHGTNGMAAALTGFSRAVNGTGHELATRRLLMLYALALSVGGIPMIYMGDELAQGNDRTPPESWPAGVDGRQLHRPSFDEDRQRHALAGLPPAGPVYSGLRRLIATRRACSAMAATVPTQVVDLGNSGLLAFRRGTDLCCAFNFTGRPQALVLPDLVPGNADGGCVDLLANTALRGTLELRPWDFVWLRPAGAAQA